MRREPSIVYNGLIERRYIRVIAAVLTVFAVFGPRFASAQIPGTLVPGRQQQEDIAPPKAVPPSPVKTPILGQQAPPQNGEDIRLVLKDIRVTGNETISDDALSHLWARYRGTDISILRIYEVAAAITKYYADKGYVLSFAFVPEQEITDNIVVIRVVEGSVDKVIFKEGAKTVEPPAILRNLAEKIRQSRPLKVADMERYMLLMNDLPGYTVQGTFVPSQADNASDLVINLQHKTFGASIGFDNHLVSTLGRYQARASVTMNSVLTGSDALQIEQGCGHFCNVYSQYGGQWSTALNSEGTRLSLGGSQSMETPNEGVLVPLDFHGRSESYTIDLKHPVVRSRQTNTDIGGSLGWVDSYTKTFAGLLTRDRVRTATAYGSYDYAYDSGGISQLKLNVTKGLPVMGATEKDDDLRSRSGGSGDFVTSSLYASHYQPLDNILSIGRDYAVVTSANLQQTLSDPLLSVYQCYYGGDNFGRGYESGVLSGDSCAMGSMEFQRTIRVEDNLTLQLYAFGDGGYVKRKGALAAGEKKSEAATSVGFGARALIGVHVQGEFQVGWPLQEELTSNGKSTPRGLFSLSIQF